MNEQIQPNQEGGISPEKLSEIRKRLVGFLEMKENIMDKDLIQRGITEILAEMSIAPARMLIEQDLDRTDNRYFFSAMTTFLNPDGSEEKVLAKVPESSEPSGPRIHG